jgi:hypothetical protein
MMAAAHAAAAVEMPTPLRNRPAIPQGDKLISQSDPESHFLHPLFVRKTLSHRPSRSAQVMNEPDQTCILITSWYDSMRRFRISIISRKARSARDVVNTTS